MNRRITEMLKFPESFRIPYLGGKWYSFLNYIDNKSIIKEKIPKDPINQLKREENVIVSLTSYPGRIEFVHLAIKSLMIQTYKPDRILLWLAEEQFENRVLPKSLVDLTQYGLEICWMHDVYGHKKYMLPIINQSKNEVVITYDDDIIYPPKSIERIIKAHKKHPNCVICERGQSYDSNIPDNPGKWKVCSNLGVTLPSYSINPSPGGGCLIPFGAFHTDACKENLIRALAFKNDDLWYMFMCAENGTRIIRTQRYHKTFSTINGSQNEQMATQNVINDYNTYVMKKLIETYPDAWKRIVTDAD